MHHNLGAHVLQLLKPSHLEPALRNQRRHHGKSKHSCRVAPVLSNGRKPVQSS